ncbi:MAG: hypothetical protein HYY30_11000 [Chloroflexi bacterium]|nr:hypothetical protein [Chloroflexota bacterium]
MYNLLRIHLESIGHGDARFDPLELDFRGGPSTRPPDTALWLRNGGGKTSLLALFYSLLEPDRRHFLGGRNSQKKSIEHYVKGDDVAHVVAEWGRAIDGDGHLPGFGATALRLVTGQVLACRTAGGKQELERHFYAFRPHQGVLEIDTLPFRRDERHRMPYQDFLSALRRLRDEQPRLEMMVTDNQRAWRQYLENSFLDPEVFRYQLVMNDDEGGAAAFLDFKDGDSFVAFLLRLVTDTTRVGQVDANINRLAKLFAERPTIQLELAFAEGIAERGPALAAARQTLAEAHVDFEKHRQAALTLFSRISASTTRARKEQSDLEAQTGELQARLTVAEKERELLNDQLLALDEIMARFRLERAQLALQESRAEVAKRKREAEAWAIAEDRLRWRAFQGEIEALRVQLGADTFDLRRSFEAAAARYRFRLTLLLQEAARQVEAGEREAREAEGKFSDAQDLIRKATEQVATLKVRQQDLEGKLDEVEEQRAQLILVGALRPEESPSDALSRVEGTLVDADRRLGEIDAKLSRLDTDRSNLQAEQSKRQIQLARAKSELNGLREKRAALAKQLSTLAGDPDVLDAMGGTVADILACIPTIKAQLMDRAAEANRELVSIGVDTEDVRRALEHLRITGYLPPSRDVERAIELLEQHDLAASSGWQHLAENVRDTERSAFIERNVALVTGVVVNRGDLDEALKVLEPEFIPNQPLIVADSRAWKLSAESDSPGNGHRVLAPSSAYYDPAAADVEQQRYTARIKEAEHLRVRLLGYQERIQRLHGELARLQEESPAEGLAFFDDKIEVLELEVDGLTAQIDSDMTRLVEIQTTELGLRNARRSLERDRVRLGEHKVRLEIFCPQAARIADWRKTLEDVTRDIASTTATLWRAEAACEAARTARANAQRRIAEAQSNRVALMFQEQEIKVDIGAADGDIADDVSIPLEVLKQAYQTAHLSYEIQMSHSETAQRLRLMEEQLAPLEASFRNKPVEFLHLVDALLDRPDAATGVGRAAATARAQEVADRAVKELGVREKEVKDEEDNVRTKTVGGRKIDLPPELVPSSYDDAAARLADIRQQVDVVQRRRTSLDNDLRDVANRLNQVKQHIDVLILVAKRIEPKLNSHETALSENALATIEPISVDDAKNEVELVAQALLGAEMAVQTGTEELRNSAKILRSFVQGNDFDKLAPVIRNMYVDDDDNALATTATEQAEEIARRRTSLNDELKKLNTHRSGVVLELTDLVKEALTTLEEAQGIKLPKGLGEWSGQPYLRINYDDPDPDQIQGRIHAFVDDLIRAEKARVEGVAMLIEAAHAAVGRQPFKVTVLKPNEGLPRTRVPVGEIRNWSGGQKLTTALLVYCVLTRLRMKNVNRRGRFESQANVLLLDNPIGTANLVDLVDLQLKVARELDIQLIITTGVNDYQAIAAYPNVIRLRNRKDQRSKLSYVVMEPGVDGGDGGRESPDVESAVTAARVLRLGDLPHNQVTLQ